MCRGLDFSTPWRERFEVALEDLKTSLTITHPVMRRLLELWQEQRLTSILHLHDLR